MSCTKDNIFYDTNILVYAYDESEKVKRETAEKLVEKVFSGETKGVISNQVLSEMFFVLTEKIGRPLDKEVAALIVRKYVLSDKWQKINYTETTTLNAAFSSSNHNNPFWDVLITQTMKENDVVQILTENEKDFKGILGVKIINPFR